MCNMFIFICAIHKMLNDAFKRAFHLKTLLKIIFLTRVFRAKPSRPMRSHLHPARVRVRPSHTPCASPFDYSALFLNKVTGRTDTSSKDWGVQLEPGKEAASRTT